MNIDQIIVMIQPFTLKQEIHIYKNNKHIIDKCSLKDLNEFCYKLCNAYNINKLSFYGNIKFTSKLKEKFMTKYDNCGININLISK